MSEITKDVFLYSLLQNMVQTLKQMFSILCTAVQYFSI